jgi:hydroxymethylpyrimidine pyrophosphatase-like HAD family hydrolase
LRRPPLPAPRGGEGYERDVAEGGKNRVRYVVLACDYDGTLACDGQVEAPTVAALEQVRASGRRLVLVTGRELADLQQVCPHLELFDRVVAENGAVLYRPATREERLLAEPPPPALVEALQRRGVTPLRVGRAIVATWQPHETTVLAAIRDLGLERQVIFNKGAVMVLPAGVNKASGLLAALDELRLSPHNAVGIGDAENDHAFLSACECGVAVANALPLLKERADHVTAGDHGAGVRELIAQLLADDLAVLAPRLHRHDILLGADAAGQPVALPPYGATLLVAGPSGSGKSTAATAVLERLAAAGYQFCLIDPEGDYEAFAGAIALGDTARAPSVDEVVQVLDEPRTSVVVSLLGLALADRPAFFAALLPRLQALRAQTGRPHWIVLDEAHHLLPATWDPAVLTLPEGLGELMLLTVHPDRLARAVLRHVTHVVAVGEAPGEPVGRFARAAGQRLPARELPALQPGEVLVWPLRAGAPRRVRVAPAQTERLRHRRKYAAGELGPDKSFYFRGPEGRLNLRAQNLVLFVQLAEGVDDATWLYHLHRGDYSRWLQEAIKDAELADEVARVERAAGEAAASRAAIKAAIEARYTLPA